MKKPIILVVEDEEAIHDALDIILSEKFELIHAMNGVDGLKKAIRNLPDLVMLDLKMPEMDGYQMCSALRGDREFDNVPIVVVSAYNNAAEKAKAFQLGADDYVTKPFDKIELIARLQRKLDGKLLQVNKDNAETQVTYEEFELNSQSQSIQVGSKKIQLSGVEFKILKLLADQFMHLVGREKILEEVWEKQDVSARLIDPHILSLRNKLKGVNLTIQSVYRRGYIFKKI